MTQPSRPYMRETRKVSAAAFHELVIICISSTAHTLQYLKCQVPIRSNSGVHKKTGAPLTSLHVGINCNCNMYQYCDENENVSWGNMMCVGSATREPLRTSQIWLFSHPQHCQENNVTSTFYHHTIFCAFIQTTESTGHSRCINILCKL